MYQPLDETTFNALKPQEWDSMTVDQLTKQLDILTMRISAAHALRSDSGYMIRQHLHEAHTRLLNLIDARFNNNKQ